MGIVPDCCKKFQVVFKSVKRCSTLCLVIEKCGMSFEIV